MTVRLALLALLEAKEGKGAELGAFLESRRTLAAAESGTVTWYAFKISESEYGIFDTFETEDARQERLHGEIPRGLAQVAPDLLAADPDLRMVDVIAVKCTVGKGCSSHSRTDSHDAQSCDHWGRLRGGLAAAKALSGQGVEVTLVDQRNFHTFLPLLYEVATAGLDPGDVAYPVRAVIGRTPNIGFRLGKVTGIVWQERVVCFNDTKSGHDPSAAGCEDDVPYDSLILASVAIANFFGIPGAAEYTLPLYTLQDARHLRDHLLLRLEEADGDLAHASDRTGP